MNIALIVYSLTVKGGGQRQLLELAKELKKRGHNITIYTTELDTKECYPNIINSFTIRYLRKVEGKPTQYSSYYNFSQQLRSIIDVYSLGRMIARENFDIINPHEWPASWSSIFAKIFNSKNKKIIWMCNDLWHQYNPFIENNTIVFKIRAAIDRLLINLFIDKIIVLDHRMAALARKFYSRDIKVVYSGIDINKFKNYQITEEEIKNIKKGVGLSKNDIFLFSFGIFFPQRRYEDVLAALNILINKRKRKNIKYLIIGSNKLDSGYYNKIMSLIDHYKLQNIVKIITHSITDQELLQYYSSCDIFIFPNDKQTWGLAAIEAMALGRACIVSRGSGVHEVLSDSRNALLFKPRSKSEIVSKILLLINNKQLREHIGLDAQKLVVSNFSWSNYADSMEREFLRNENKN